MIAVKLSEEPVATYLQNPVVNKPIVTFLGEPKFVIHDTNNFVRARIYALNHPRLGKCLVTTGPVILLNDDESFETLNTIYKHHIDIEESMTV